MTQCCVAPFFVPAAAHIFLCVLLCMGGVYRVSLRGKGICGACVVGLWHVVVKTRTGGVQASLRAGCDSTGA